MCATVNSSFGRPNRDGCSPLRTYLTAFPLKHLIEFENAHSVRGENEYLFLIFRMPLQNIMDGDLCEQFTSLDPAKQKTIATDLGRTPNEVAKKLEDIRTRYAF